MTGRTKKGRFDYAAVPVVEPAQPEVQEQPKKRKVPEQIAKRAKGVAKAVESESKMLEAVKSGALAPKQGTMTLLLGDPDAMTVPPQRRGRPDLAGEGRMAVEREQLNVRVMPDLKRAAAAMAGLQGITLGDVVEAALVDYLRKHT